MRRQAALLLALAFVTVEFAPLAIPATQHPGDVTGTDAVGIPAATWTGTVYQNNSIVIPAGGLLTVENATVLWGGNDTVHKGLTIAPGGKLVVRDSVIKSGAGGDEMNRTKSYWDFTAYGVFDMQRSVLMHASDLCIQADGTSGSIIKDSEVAWTSRGIHAIRTNATGTQTVELTLDNVSIHDMPSLGGGCPDIGGAIGVLGGNVDIRNVTVSRALGTGLFVDRSTVAQNTGVDGDSVHAQDLLVVAGSPTGEAIQGKLAEIRTLGSFTCDRCSFVSPHGTGQFLVDDGEIAFRHTSVANAHVDVVLQSTTSGPVVFDGLQMLGPNAEILYTIYNNGHATFLNTSFEPGATRAAFNQWPLDNRRQSLPGVWWGDASGPADPDLHDNSVPLTNPGLGRIVAGPIDYTGWATTPPADFHDIRLAVGAHPASALGGTTLVIPVTVTNGGDRARDVALSAASVVGATVAPANLTLAPGESATALVDLPVATGLPVGTVVSADLVARSEGEPSIAVVGTTIASDRPTLALGTPAPYDLVSGAVTATGRVVEPLAGPTNASPASATSPGPSGLGPMDVNGDRVDDRLEVAPGIADVIITHTGVDESGLRADIVARGGTIVRAFDLAPIVWAKVDAAQLPAIARSHGVRGIWWDDPSVPSLALNVRAIRARTSQEGVLAGGVPTGADYAGVWRGNPRDGYQGVTGHGVLVAVVDSGVDSTHSSLDDMDDNPLTVDPKVVGHISTVAVLATGNTSVVPNGVTTPGAHATMVAGTLAGTGAGFLGSPDAPLDVSTPEDLWLNAGAAPGAQILDVQAFQETSAPVHPGIGGLDVLPQGSGVGLAIQGFQAVADWNRAHPDQLVRIVSCSLAITTTATDHPLNDVANALVDTGVVVIVAAGNNDDGIEVPASASKVLAVGAVDTDGTVARNDDFHARFSDVVNPDQYAAGLRKPEIVAPGVNIAMPAMGTGDKYTVDSGTSFATPLTSAVAALVLEANPNLTAAQVKEILVRSSEPRGGSDGTRYTDVNLDGIDDLDDGGWTPDWGFGYLDAEEAVRLARVTEPRAAPEAPILTLYADGASLASQEPAATGVAASPASFGFVAANGLVLGDEDATTQDAATFVINSPSADQDLMVTRGTVTLRVDNVTVAQTGFNDPEIAVGTASREIGVPLLLGKLMHYNTTGDEANRYNVTDSLPVLDAKGDLVVRPGAYVEIDVEATHLNNVPAPLLTGPGGSRLVAPLDPATLPDTQPPSAVSGVQVSWDATSANITWGPASDNVAVGSYTIVRDGAAIATVPRYAHAYVDATLAPGTTHAYTVRASDMHGDVGPDAPAVQVVAPPASGRAVVVDFDGASVLATDATGNGSYESWTAQLLPTQPGRHTLRASLFVGGVLADTKREEVTLGAPANLPPVVTIPPINEIVHGARSVAFQATDPNGAADIAQVLARIDNGPWFPAGQGVVSISAIGLPDGAHTLTVQATDMSGAVGNATAAFQAQAWAATLRVPNVVLDGVPTLIGADLAGTAAASAQPTLVATGVANLTMPLTFDGTRWGATLPPLRSGELRLAVVQGNDTLGERDVVVDRPPAALVLGPATATRLDTVTLRDASVDDEGIAARLWRLPDGSTSTAATVAFAPFALPVGDATIELDATNVHGLTSVTTFTLHVLDLAPKLVAGPFRLGNLAVDHALTGETISIALNASDPEGDPLAYGGGLSWNATGSALFAPNATTLFERPTAPGLLTLDATLADPWLSTEVAKTLPVVANQPPHAALDVPVVVRANRLVAFDARNSTDPDRFLVDRELSIPGLVDSHAALTNVTLPLGVWNATLTVTDTSGATDTLTRSVTADDWLSLARVGYIAPTLTESGFLRVAATWSDGAPASNASLDVTVAHALAPDEPLHHFVVKLDANGRAAMLLPTDTMVANLPGTHLVRALVRADARPVAPIQGEKTDELDFAYDVG